METKMELVWYADVVRHRGPIDGFALWSASAYAIITVPEGSVVNDVELEDEARKFIGHGVDVDPDSLEVIRLTWVLMDTATAPA